MSMVTQPCADGELSEDVRAVVQYAAENDTRWFASHPGKLIRERRLFPDELAPYYAPDARRVAVVNDRGLLHRTPLTEAQAHEVRRDLDKINAAALAVVEAARSRKAVS